MPSVFGPAFDVEWRKRFERFAEGSTTEADVSGWSTIGLSRRVAIFSRLVDSLDMPAGNRVLDLGCGAGTYSRLLAKGGLRVFGVDYSAPSLRRAIDYDPAGICHYAATDGYALPFPAGTFDLVVCIGVLQAVALPTAVIDEAARVLRPKGVFVTEALNARAVSARVGRARARLRGLPPRVRHYDPRTVDGWLDARGFTPITRLPIVLPPRRMPRLAAFLDAPRVRSMFETDFPFSEALAHSFLFVARRVGDGPATCATQEQERNIWG